MGATVQYDITLGPAGSPTGLMLVPANQRTGADRWSVRQAEDVPPAIQGETGLNYGLFAPNVAAAFSKDDWQGGMGWADEESGPANGYYLSQGVLTHISHQVTLGPWLRTSRKATDDFTRADASTLGTSWSNIIGTFVGTWGIRSNAAALLASGGANNVIWFLDQAASDGVVGVTFSVAQDDMRLVFRGIDQNSHWFVRHSGTAWQLCSVSGGTVTVQGSYTAALASGDTVWVDFYTTSITVYINGTARISATSSYNQTQTSFGLGAGASVTSAGRFDTFVCYGGQSPFNGLTAPTTVSDMPLAVRSAFILGDSSYHGYVGTSGTWLGDGPFSASAQPYNGVEFDFKFYIAMRGTANYRRASTYSFANGTTATVIGNVLEVANNRLYRVVNDATGLTAPVLYAAPQGGDPIASPGLWVTVGRVGTSGYSVSAMRAYQSSMVIFKNDGLYAVDRDGNVTPILKMWGTPPTMNQVIECGGVLYFVWNNEQIWAYTPGGLRQVGLETRPGLGVFLYNAGALASDGRYLYLMAAGALYSYEPKTNAWCRIGGPFKPASMSGLVHVPASYLFWDASAGANYPTNSTLYSLGSDTYVYESSTFEMANPLQFGNREFCPQGILTERAWTGLLPDLRKMLLGIEVWAEDITATETILVEYRLDKATSWTTLGTVNSTTISQGRALLTFPTGGGGTSAKRLELRYTLTRRFDDPTKSPVMRAMTIYYVTLTEDKREWQFSADLSFQVGLLNGTRATQDPDTLLSTLWAMHNTIQTLTDQDGVSYAVKVTVVGETEQAFMVGQRRIDRALNISAVEWSLS